MFVMFVKALFILIRTVTDHLHVVVMAVVGVVLQVLTGEHHGVPQLLLLTAGRALAEAKQVLTGTEVDVSTARRVGGHQHHLGTTGLTHLDGDFGVRIDKSGIDGVGSDLVVFTFLLQPGSIGAAAGQILHTVGVDIKLVMGGVHWVVEQILGGHNAVVHLDGPHVLTLAGLLALQAGPGPGPDLGVAVYGGADVKRSIMVLQVIVTLGTPPTSSKT